MIAEHSKNAPEHDPTKTGERNKAGHVQHAAVSSAPPRLQGVSLDPSVEIRSCNSCIIPHGRRPLILSMAGGLSIDIQTDLTAEYRYSRKNGQKREQKGYVKGIKDGAGIHTQQREEGREGK